MPGDSMRLLSHSDGTLLPTHLNKVAGICRELACEFNGISPTTAYLAGLLHDAGKVTPHYQESFSKGLKPGSTGSYSLIRGHSAVSAMASRLALDSAWSGEHTVLRHERAMLSSIIFAHHGRLPFEIGLPLGKIPEKNRELMKSELDSIARRLEELFRQLREEGNAQYLPEHFSELKPYEIHKPADVPVSSAFDEFISQHLLFSALLQADRGSFGKWLNCTFNQHFETSVLTETRAETAESATINALRSQFQETVLNNATLSSPVLVLQAPTGIGKTKLFLDLANRIAAKRRNDGKPFQRIIYFSPLLALSEDFEIKIAKTLDKHGDGKAQVFVYNHTYRGTLEQREQNSGDEQVDFTWRFEDESFNHPIIVTTTQRLLLTLFSNYHKDGLKLASFRKSMLILDEVQTIPPELLEPTLDLLGQLAKRADSVVLLVSATIPAPLEKIPRIIDPALVSNTQQLYLDACSKQVRYRPEIGDIPSSGRRALMFNTRKAAFLGGKTAGCEVYLSSGVRKNDRSERIKQLRRLSAGSSVLVACTQVLEAGVDLSFDFIFRQLAPLDSLIQTMGRLNRFGENSDSMLYVFEPQDIATADKPYSPLEIKLTRDILAAEPETTSVRLLSKLEAYYKSLYERDGEALNNVKRLVSLMAQSDHPRVAELATEFSGFSQEGVTAIVPENEIQRKEFHEELMDSSQRRRMEKYAGWGANFPYGRWKSNSNLFEPDLLEKGIMLPTTKALEMGDSFYHPTWGFDIWTDK